jgi:hypothetical protein
MFIAIYLSLNIPIQHCRLWRGAAHVLESGLAECSVISPISLKQRNRALTLARVARYVN